MSGLVVEGTKLQNGVVNLQEAADEDKANIAVMSCLRKEFSA